MSKYCLRYKNSLLWASRRLLVSGRATYEGTKTEIAASGVELFHKLERANLLITPIIHGLSIYIYVCMYDNTYISGPPSDIIRGPDSDANAAIIQALLHNKSNAVYVYQQYLKGAWYSAQVATMCKNGFPREGAVCIADLGYAARKEELAKRLREASKLTQLELLDIAIIKVCN